MPTDIAIQTHNGLVTPEQLTVIKETICKDATPEEMELYFFDCQRNGVHPLDRLIHFTKRKSKNKDGTWSSKYTPITSIDFFRMRAESSGEYAGQDDAVFTGEVSKPGFKASVTVYRFLNGQRVPIPASAWWEEYKPEGEFSLWSKMPHLMLAKCAEALALRKGFPKQLHGLYTTEEMAQAERKGAAVETPVLQGANTKEHLATLAAKVKEVPAEPEKQTLTITPYRLPNDEPPAIEIDEALVAQAEHIECIEQAPSKERVMKAMVAARADTRIKGKPEIIAQLSKHATERLAALEKV